MPSRKEEIEDLKKANAILHKLITNRDAEIDRLRAENARLKANESNILSVVNCDFNSRRNLG